jgi:ABC-type nitrate/sulfonate/bicarbonate transport system substrate-binding protein
LGRSGCALILGRVLPVALLLWVIGAAPALAQPLRVATAQLTYFSPALVAGWQGFFAAEGLQVEVIPCVNGRRCLKHLTDHEADVATVADTPIVLAAHQGEVFQIVATMTTSRDNSFVVRTDRGIATPADLRGKRIGYVRGTSAHYFTDTFLTYHGITLDQITPVELDAARAPQQLAAGEVDAAGLYQPHGPKALQLLGSQGRVLPAPRLYTATMNLVVRPGVSDADAVKLLRALQRANAYLRADAQRAQAQVARELRLDPASVRASWDLLSFRLSLGQSLLTTLEAQSRWMRRTDQVEGDESPDFLSMMRPGPLKQVDPSAVTLVD